LRPPSTKFTEFELKNWCKSAEEAKAEFAAVTCFFFERNKTHLAVETNSTKL